MVHGLEVIRKLNETPVGKPDNGKKSFVPPEIASRPFIARAFTNRPWTKKELGSQPDVYESYAKSAKAPFRPEAGQREGLRT
jgi:hypothetical protein